MRQLTEKEKDYQFDTILENIASAALEVVFQDETGQTDSYVIDPYDFLQTSDDIEILKMAQQVELSQDGKYRVLTRNESKLGKMYHCDTLSKIDFTDRDGVKCTILELQWAY